MHRTAFMLAAALALGACGKAPADNQTALLNEAEPVSIGTEDEDPTQGAQGITPIDGATGYAGGMPPDADPAMLAARAAAHASVSEHASTPERPASPPAPESPAADAPAQPLPS